MQHEDFFSLVQRPIITKDEHTYQTGTAFPTEISLNPSPNRPSNFATKNVTLGSLVASINS
jgi:hypothetical protein